MDESGIEATQALDLGDYDDEDVTDDELSDSTPVAYLNVACQKGFPGKLFPVYEGDNVIGRGDECKISIPLKALSREHACIEVKGDAHFIYDKGSRNRTRRNNHFLAASVRYELKGKDKLIFGDVECEYQVGTKAADDSDETGSESMFQTAPDDEELENSTEIKNETEVKPPEDEDYASDASSDILEPTQPFVGNTQSMLGHKTLSGNSTLAQNITVKETPAAPRTKRFTEDIVLPESGSDTDDEYSTKPPPTLAIAADSQDDDEDEELKSRMMGAATQAYVCESDISTDNEENISHKRSLLAAPTQAFADDDDSTCSEDSPKKEMLLTAATQAFAADTDEEKSSKKQDKIGPTVPYTMDVDIEPTQGYDMEVDAEEKDENVEEGKKSSSILYEPTQAYVESETTKDQDEGEGSDTSEEFVLEGDTDAEDEGDDGEMLAAPTLACDDPGQEVVETQVVSTEDPTQVFDDPKPTGKKGGHKLDETLPVTELETQVFEENNKTSKKPVTNDDATQVFDENIQDGKNNELEAMSHAADTQVLDEKATQVFDTERKNEQTAETQVFNDDATQCFDDESNGKVKSSEVVDTKVFDEPTQVVDGDSDNKKKLSEQNEIATQVFDKIDDVVSDDEGRTFDITAASTLAVNEDLNEDSNNETSIGADDATQVFDSAVGVDQTVQIEAGICQKSRGKRKKNKVVAETVAVSDATQVLTEELVQSNPKNEKKKQIERNNDNDAATQVFDETLVVNEDQTVANKEEHTLAVDDGSSQIIEDKPATKPTRGEKKKKVTAGGTVTLSDDPNQVNDQTVAVTEDQTVAVTEDQTIAVTEDQTDASHEGASQDLEVKPSQSKASRRRRAQAKKIDDKAEVTKDVTQDETIAVNENQTVALTEENPDANKAKLSKVKTRGRRKQVQEIDETKTTVNIEAIQVLDENVQGVQAEIAAVKPISNLNVESKGNKAIKKVKNETVAENMKESRLTKSADCLSVEVNEKNGDEPNSITTGKSRRTRGKPSIIKNGGKKEELLNESKKTEQKDDKTKQINESIQTKRGKKTGIANKKAEWEATANISAETEQPSEVATQRYGDSGDEAAFQRYGDSGDEAATQKYGEVEDEDSTPDLEEIVEEKKETVPVVAETSRGRSTLKSALASPQRRKSPSPKKVQFVSQDSETGSESAGPTRRSRRGNKVKQKGVETELSATSKESVAETQSKKTRQKAVEKVHSESDKESGAVKELEEDNETVASVVKSKVNKRQDRNKDIEINGNLDNVESGPVANAAVKSTRRGRKSVDTEVNNKEENNKRKVRVSLPAVLEENELGASKNRGKKKVNKTSGDEKGNTNEELGKNLRGKDIIHEQKEENKSDTTLSVKRSARHTKEAVEENKTKSPKETRSDTPINNSETVTEPKTTRSCRNVRKRDKNEALESKNSISKDKELENVKADGDKKEPSTQASARTRKSKSNTEESQTCEVKDGKGSVVITDDKSNARSKAGKRVNRKSNVESEASESQINEVKNDITDKNTEQTDSIDKLTDKAGKSGKGKKAKSETEVPVNDKNAVKTDQEVNKRSKGSIRNKKGDVSKGDVKEVEQEGFKEDNLPNRSSRLKGDVSKVVVKEEKQEQVKEDNLPARSRRLKRKESDNSSSDSQESKGETPAKRQKQKTNNLSTPKNKGKETCTVTTPRQLDTSITNSPTLRKTTTEGGKAKVMFTGVIDEQGEKIVKELGGELVSSVTECTHLVTDQVRRTVKFLCCLSRGIPIVSPQWLASSKTSAFFVDPTPFLVQDDASERKYKFRLYQSIDKASKELVFQGFTFHVTKSVKPEPQHMSEILKCAGAKYTNKMPCSGQGLTVVISCPEDQGQCERAYEAGIPVMTAEFVLTGILRQEVDFQSFRLVKEENGRKRQATTLGHDTSKKRKR